MEKANMPTISLSITVKNSADALQFYAVALGAKEVFRMPTPDGGIGHAEFKIGNTHIYMSDEAPDWHAYAMPEGEMASCLFSIITEDCDKSYEQALKAGAESLSPPQDQFWGARSAIIKDPFGYRWSFHQQIEEVTPEKLAKRAEAYFSTNGS
ncbi:MAG: VOC family protein [Deltaproteobacteria bacterium]|nr:VOC family protein [Deltaproteobacteria bacterium]